MTNKLSNLEIQSESDFCNHYPAKSPTSNYSSRPKRFDGFRKGLTRTLAGLLMLGASIVGAAGLSSCENPYQSSTNTTQVTKVNHAPVITSFSINPDSGSAPLSITAEGNATDPDRDPLSYSTVIKDKRGNTIKESKSNSIDYDFQNSGEYEVIFTATDGKLSKTEKKLVTVSAAPTNPPTVDLSTILNSDGYNSTYGTPVADLDEEVESVITLPSVDSDNKSVTYTLGGSTNLEDVILNGNILTLKSGDISTNESYSVDIECTETATGKRVTISPLTGTIHNHPDISIEGVKSSGDHVSIKQAIAEAGYVDSNGVYQHLNNFVSNNGTGTFTDCKENEGIYSTSDGKIDFQIEERADELAKIAPNGFSVKVGKGTPVEYTDSEGKTHATASGSFLQTQDFSTDSNGKGDYSGLEFVVATYDNSTVGLPGSGATYSPEQFFDFCNQVNFRRTIQDRLVTYNVKNIEIMAKSPIDGSTFSDLTEITSAAQALQQAMPYLSIIVDDASITSPKNGKVENGVLGEYTGQKINPNPGWLILAPISWSLGSSNNSPLLGGNLGITDNNYFVDGNPNYTNPIINGAVSYIGSGLNGNIAKAITMHEGLLGSAFPKEPTTYTKKDTLSAHDIQDRNSISKLDKCYINKIVTESVYANKKASDILSYSF